MDAETAARKILDACAIGDAEAVIGLPAKVGAAMQAICPNLTAVALSLVNRMLPEPGGIGNAVAKGWESRGQTEASSTASLDRAALANNEIGAATLPPPLS